MSKKKPELSDLLSNIQLKLAQDLLARIENGTADSSTLNVARQLLRDNNIKVSLKGEDGAALRLLGKKVPFPPTGTD